MTIRQRALVFVLSVTICSILSCGLTVIARQNDVFLSGRKPAVTLTTTDEVKESPSRGRLSGTQALWPWGRVMRGSVEHDDKTGLAWSNGQNDVSKNRLGREWMRMLRERMQARNLSVSLRHMGSTLGRWSVWAGEAAQRTVRSGWTRINQSVGTMSAKSNAEQGSSFGGINGRTVPRNWKGESVRASDEALRSEGTGDGRGSITIVLAGLTGIIACALIGMGAVQLVRGARRDDEEGEVRRTLFDERRKSEEVVERIVRDTIDNIMPEDAV